MTLLVPLFAFKSPCRGCRNGGPRSELGALTCSDPARAPERLDYASRLNVTSTPKQGDPTRLAGSTASRIRRGASVCLIDAHVEPRFRFGRPTAACLSFPRAGPGKRGGRHMDSSLKQDTRLAQLTTPAGKDELVLQRFDGVEGLSELFEYRIEAIAKKEIDFDAILGRSCSVMIKVYDKERHFNGILVEAQWVGIKQEHHVYRLVLRPWLWLCSRTSDCRFFQDKTAPDIIQQVFKDRGFNDVRTSLSESYPELEYCVQYRESDLAFVSRLMEQHGIYYFFEHTSDKHMLVLADSMSAHQAVPGLGQIDFIPLGNSERRDRQHIYHLVSERRFRTGKVELNDYYELEPNADLKADKKGTAKYNKSDMEFYDYPGKYKKKSDGEKYAKVVLEAEQALDERRHTDGNAPSLFPGGTTKLQQHMRSSENKDYLVVRASHLYVAEHYRSGTGAAHHEYSGHYEFLPKDKQFRAPIVTPKPLIHGIQTAKVVGKNKSDEIDVDEHGRILVQFFWDRKKDKQSCRIRVAEVWAGKKWGGQFIP